MCFMGERNGRSRISGNCFHWWSKAQGTSITLIEFAVSEDDIDITSCCVFDLDKCRGSSLFPLQGSKVLAIPEKNTPDQEDHGLKFLLWGGIKAMTMACANELFQVKLSPKEKRNKRSFNGAKKSESLDFVVDITAYMAVSQQESSSSKFYQSGTILSPRTGHSLAMITNELAVLFGGITLDNREHGVEHVFQQTCRDGSFYLLNMNGYTWLCLSGTITALCKNHKTHGDTLQVSPD